MRRSVSKVFDAALALDEDHRAKLVARLVESLDASPDRDVPKTWASEIERRLAKIEAGQARWLSNDEAIARMRGALRGR